MNIISTRSGRVALALLCLAVFLSSKLVFALDYVKGINNPNGQTIKDRNFAFNFMTYNNGGLQSKILVSIFDPFDLGVTFDVQRAIGDRTPKFHVPGVVGKVQITEGTQTFPMFLAIGYDSFFTDIYEEPLSSQEPTIEEDARYVYMESEEIAIETVNTKHLEQTIYGPYVVLTKPVYLFEFEQYLNFGVRMPTQPDYRPEDLSLFMGFDVPLGSRVVLQTEIDRVYFDARRLSDVLFNIGAQLAIVENFRISLHLMMGYKRNTNRVMTVQYTTQF